MFKNNFTKNFIKGKTIKNKYIKWIYYYLFIYRYVKNISLLDYSSIYDIHFILKAFDKDSDHIKVFGTSIYISFNFADLLFKNLRIVLNTGSKIFVRMEDNKFIYNITVKDNEVSEDNKYKLDTINLILKDFLNIEMKNIFLKEEF